MDGSGKVDKQEFEKAMALLAQQATEERSPSSSLNEFANAGGASSGGELRPGASELVTQQQCARCFEGSHRADANYCWRCGEQLNAVLREDNDLVRNDEIERKMRDAKEKEKKTSGTDFLNLRNTRLLQVGEESEYPDYS